MAIAAGCSNHPSTPSRDWIRGYNDAADVNASASGPQWDPVHREQLCKLLAERAHGVDVAQYMAGCTADHSHGPQQP